MGKWAALALADEKVGKGQGHELTKLTEPPLRPENRLLSVLSVSDPPVLGESAPPQDPRAEARRQALFSMLHAQPTTRIAALSDGETDPGNVLLSIAIRGVATFEMRIAKDKWDGVLFMEMLERHSLH
jgi:hypothetical protein